MKRGIVAFALIFGLAFFAPLGLAVDDSKIADDGTKISVGPQNAGITTGNRLAPGSLTTIFASNNGYAGNTFDITPTVDLEITAMDINADFAPNPATVTVYYKTGTSVGYETDPNAWSTLAVGNGTIAGIDNPTFIDLSGNGMIFKAGQLYGMYVHLDYVAGVSRLGYTNGGPNTYSNSDLSLTTYNGKGDPVFTGSTFPGRIWNGTVYYDTKGSDTLSVNPNSISAATGGKVDFSLNAGATYANGQYLVMGSVTGTSPGTLLPGGTVLPVNFDAFTTITVNFANSAFFPNTLGMLDGTGQATAGFDTIGPLDPGLIGLVMYFAFPVPAAPWFASNYVTVTIDA